MPRAWDGTRETGVLVAFFAINTLLAVQIGLRARRPLAAARSGWLLTLLLAAVSIPLNLAFFKEVASPRILHLEYHHCLYDLFARAPESLVGAGMGATGVFSLGWAQLVARAEERSAGTGRLAAGLFAASALGYLGCVIHFSVALALV